jgi:integrase
MAAEVSHGSSSRRPVLFNGRAVPNLVARTTANGDTRYEFLAKRGGRRTRITLDATTTKQAMIEAEKLRPVARDGKIGRGTVRLSDLCEQFVAESRSGEYTATRPLAATTLAHYEQQIRSHVLPGLGEGRRVRDISAAELRRLIDRQRMAGLSGSTTRSTFDALKAVMRFGVRRGVLERSPCLDLDGDLPSARRTSEPVYLDLAQARDLLESLGPDFRPIAASLLYLGLRVSEALGLTWSHVDLANGTVAIRRQLGRDGRTLAPLKTRASEAVLTIPSPLLEELRSHRERQAALGFERIGPDRLVFVTRGGQRSPGRRNVLRAVQAQAELLGLRNEDGELCGLHDLRHSCAAILRGHGMSDEEIAVVLRHASSVVTRAIYGGWANADRSAVRARAAEAFGA